MPTNNGYAKIGRKLLDHWIWELRPGEKRDRGAAWQEFILRAAHRDTVVKFMGQRIQLRRGQLACTRSILWNRWNWSKGELHRYLEELKADDMVQIQATRQVTIITIQNYDRWQESLGRKLGHDLGHDLGHRGTIDSNDLEQTLGHDLGHDLGRDLGQEQEPIRTRTYKNNTPGGEQAKPADPPSEYVFPIRSGEWTLPQSKLDEYLEAYPLMDVHQELRQLRQWCRDNPGKRKTANGMKAFLTKNLNRHHNNGRYARRSDAGDNGATTTKPSDIFKDL